VVVEADGAFVVVIIVVGVLVLSFADVVIITVVGVLVIVVDVLVIVVDVLVIALVVLIVGSFIAAAKNSASVTSTGVLVASHASNIVDQSFVRSEGSLLPMQLAELVIQLPPLEHRQEFMIWIETSRGHPLASASL
jgi:hypothetical protein